MATEDSLKRLGGGRWETRDGRFAIEPQSGTWVVVDNTQTDDLGLPLVRGPFGSLTAARDAIEAARNTGPAESPLAGRLKQAAAQPKTTAKTGRGNGDGRATKAKAASTKAGAAATEDEGDGANGGAEPPTPPESKWLRDLAPADRRRARDLIGRLGELGIDDPETIARAEIVRDEPAITRLALEGVIRAAIASARSPGGAGRAVVAAIMRGKDPEFGARWKLVDDRGRRIDDLDVED
jgi:hypothetical protein